MPRPSSIQSEPLLDAARQLFYERGLQATMSQVAERAGVSEGTLFKRFGSKVQLFHAVLDGLIADKRWLEPLAGTPDDEQDLERRLLDFSARAAGRFRTLMPIVMLAWTSSHDGYLPKTFAHVPPPQVGEVEEVAAFFERAARKKVLARVDALAAAHLLLGAAQHFGILVLMESARGAMHLEEGAYARRIVPAVLDGIRSGKRAGKDGR